MAHIGVQCDRKIREPTIASASLFHQGKKGLGVDTSALQVTDTEERRDRVKARVQLCVRIVDLRCQFQSPQTFSYAFLGTEVEKVCVGTGSEHRYF